MACPMLKPILWISKIFNSNHFHKELKTSLIQDKVQFHIYYIELNFKKICNINLFN
jgi:hypothetical protein